MLSPCPHILWIIHLYRSEYLLANVSLSYIKLLFVSENLPSIRVIQVILSRDWSPPLLLFPLTEPHWPPHCLHNIVPASGPSNFLLSLPWLLFFQIMTPVLTFFRNFMQILLSQRGLYSLCRLKFRSPVLTKYTFSNPIFAFLFPIKAQHYLIDYV